MEQSDEFLLPRGPGDEFVHDAFSGDNWRYGVAFFLDDAEDPYGEFDPTNRWYAVVRIPKPYGYGESVYRISPEMQTMLEPFIAKAEADWGAA
jgi:hypothetical protein